MALERAAMIVAACVLPASALGCSQDPERPPPFVASPPANLRSCAELRARGELAGSEFTVDGQRASCAANGLKCPVAQSAAVIARCDGGTGEASCNAEIWKLTCLSLTGDSGAADAP